MNNGARQIGKRYDVEKLIGSGAVGRVYLGRDTQTGEPVAIKELMSDWVAHAPDSVERFRREGEALRKLNHPNIVKVLATLEEGDQHYLVMEYVSGGSLADLLKRRRQLPIEQVISIGLELSDALSRAHHLDIVHRDIKPGNILLAEDGTPRLTDFGLAHHRQLSGVDRSRATARHVSIPQPRSVPESTAGRARRHLVVWRGAV